MDAALLSHHEISKNRAICHVCHTRCVQPEARSFGPPSCLSGTPRCGLGAAYPCLCLALMLNDSVSRLPTDHTPGPSTSASLVVPSSSRHPTPSVEGKALNGSSGTGTNTPTSVKADGIVYFDCLSCKRQVSHISLFMRGTHLSLHGVFGCVSYQIASNRYAPHLSSCMGIGTGTRRAANRSNVKSKSVS